MKAYWRQRPIGEAKPVVKDDIQGRIYRYLSTWPRGLSTDRMGAWIQSCSRGGGYTEAEYQDGLRQLRDSGRIAIANGIWYLRKKVT